MSAQAYDVVSQYDVRIPMQDGMTLSADIFLPGRQGTVADGKFPGVLHRTIHNRAGVGSNVDYEYFVKRGYAVVIESVRGRFSSDGEFHHGIKEMEDGRDTVEWVARQPWSSGKVGMTGISYSAAVQCATAIGNPPHLSAIHHVKAPLNYYKDHSRRGARCVSTSSETHSTSEPPRRRPRRTPPSRSRSEGPSRTARSGSSDGRSRGGSTRSARARTTRPGCLTTWNTPTTTISGN